MLQVKPTSFSRPAQMERTDGKSNAVWHEPATLMLDMDGMIRDCSKSGESLFGFIRSDLVLQHISRLFPQLADIVLVEKNRINPRLYYICHCGHHFTAQDREGNTFLSKLNFVYLDNAENGILKLMVQPFRNAAGVG